MGVYIKGMDMPVSCAVCDTRGGSNCFLSKLLSYPDVLRRRHPDCPLVEVKAPHGDLVDRDAILSFIDMGHLSNHATKSWNDTEVVDMLESRPTVIEAEGNDGSA